METALNNLVATISENLWLLLLILISVYFKQFRLSGVIMLYVLVINDGYIPWWGYAILGVVSIFTSYLYPKQYYEERLRQDELILQQQLQQLEDDYMKAYKLPNPNKVHRHDPEDTTR